MNTSSVPRTVAVSYEPLAALMLHRHPANPKAHALDQIAASIRRFGFVTPLLMNERDGYVAEGHGRLEALEAMRNAGDPAPNGIHLDPSGAWLVPVVRGVSLTPAEAHAYRLAANKLVEAGGWDEVALAELLRELHGTDDVFTGLGFAEREIDELLALFPTSNDEPAADPDDAPSPRPARDIRVRPGELLRLGNHLLLVGDCRHAANLQRLAGMNRASCLLTDPPYGVSYASKSDPTLTIQNDDAEGLADLLEEAFAAADTVLAPGAGIYIFHPAGAHAVTVGKQFVGAGWSYLQGLVWTKASLVPGHSDHQYRHEPVLYGRKPGPGRWGRGAKGWYGGNDQSSVFEFPSPRSSPDHPTPKPVRLLEALLRNVTRRGDSVLDPFAGSGSTLIACEILGRRCLAIELDPRYAQVVVDRWERFTGRVAALEDA